MQRQKLIAEFLGTLLLVLTVVGSGIMGEKLSGGNIAIALLANAIATGGSLYILITVFGPISGAHFNPVVSTYFRIRGEVNNNVWLAFVLMQISGGMCGVLLAHGIFELSVFQLSSKTREGGAQWLSELIATFGLLLTIVGFIRNRSANTAAGVASYIAAAYWFTSSTSFANPAVTIARTFTDTFSGIRLMDIGGFILAQFAGLALFVGAERWIFGTPQKSAQ